MSSAIHGLCSLIGSEFLVAAMINQSPFCMISRESAYAAYLRSSRWFSVLRENKFFVATVEEG